MTDDRLHFCSDLHGQAEAVVGIFLDVYGPDRTSDGEVMVKLCNSSACFGMVAYLQGQAAGFILLQQAADSADIIEICVSPDRQAQGIGKQLLDKVLTTAIARSLHRIVLEVAVTNRPALTLYRQAGFSVVGKRPNYYRLETGPVDALVMERQLG